MSTKYRAGSAGTIRTNSSGVARAASQPLLGLRMVGMNTSDQTYFSAMIPWIDMMKCASDWFLYSGTGDIDQDENGWLMSLAPGQVVLSNLIHVVNTNVPNWNTPGNYVVVYYTGDGSGLGTNWNFSEGGPGASVSVISHDTSAKRIVLSVTHTTTTGNYFRVGFSVVNESDPVMNIKVMPEIYEAAYLAGDRFHPDFLADYENFAGVRAMNWANVRDSEQTTWADRRTMSHRNYSGYSSASTAKHAMVPYEEHIALANLLDADLQVCVPHLSGTDWWTGLAELCYDTFSPTRRLFVERSNETWNNLFDQFHDDYAAGQLLYPSEPNAYYRGRYYSAHMARLVMEDFEAVYADRMDKLVRVFAWQKDTVFFSELLVEWEGLEDHIDHWQIAPYFSGVDNGDTANHLGKDPQATVSAGPAWSDITVNLGSEEILAGCVESLTADMDHVEEIRDLMASKGIGLSFYECGQHLVANTTTLQNNTTLTAVFVAANRHAGMRQTYLDYWRRMRGILGDDNGAIMFHYADYYTPDKYGSWGLKEYQGQPDGDAPKWLGTMDFIEETT